jgi:deaminated glutathione amidase
MAAIPRHVALIQLRSGRDIGRNVAVAEGFIREAAGAGASYIQTPENTTVMDEDKARLIANVTSEEKSQALTHFRDLARELKVWVHIGSMAVAHPSGKLANRSLLIDPNGVIAARYDKIHMFDVDLGGSESYRESRNFEPGTTAVVADVEATGLGLTVCYDLRFPHLYRSLAQAGAKLLAVPAAFTKQTGTAHWHVLLRARAIENGCYVLAAAQGGTHENGRETYGHSLIVAPTGEVIAEAGIEPVALHAHIDLGVVDDFRRKIPSLTHDRTFTAPAGKALT